MKLVFTTLLLCISLAGCDDHPSQGQGWKVVGQLSDGLKTRFVEVSRDRLNDRATYDKAVTTLCNQQNICVIAYFSPDDRVPPDQTSKTFFSNGGFKDYSPVVVWWSNNNTGVAGFTTWDCQRAGSEGAPLDALCGDGVSEAYSAVLSLAGRAGMAEACNWVQGDEMQMARSYIGTLKDAGRREQFQKALDTHYSSSRKGPDKPDDCKRRRAKVEENAKLARSFLRRARSGS